jgi:hypothetical protein
MDFVMLGWLVIHSDDDLPCTCQELCETALTHGAVLDRCVP